MGIVAKAIRVNNLTPHNELTEDEGLALDDVLTDDRGKDPEKLLIEADDLDRIFSTLSGLEEREATVIRMRFGLESYAPMTLREVGEIIGAYTRARAPTRKSGAAKTDGIARRCRRPDRELISKQTAL